MEFKQNLHGHTSFCDGKDSAEDIVKYAVENGFDSVGFSGHGHSDFSPVFTMTLERTKEYVKEIYRLKREYQDQIELYCGLELDLLSDLDLSPYEYVIGSLHALNCGDEILAFDRSAEVVKGLIDKYFNGDGMAYAKEYYRTFAEYTKKRNFDVVGHFDLITKHTENVQFFNTESSEYKNIALECLHSIFEKVKIFEVNTGAMARGYRTTPYPAPFIMKELKSLGARIIISSDSHKKEHLDYAFGFATDYVKSFGFDHLTVLKKGKFTEITI